MIPGAITAASMTAATVGLLFLVFRRLVSLRSALLSTGLMAFGTSLWTVAAAEVWPHTVDAFCLALTAYALSRRRWWIAGLALGLGVVARPHIAVIALVVGLGLGWSMRSMRPVFGVGLPASAGLVFVELWNSSIYGTASVSGGYAGYVQANLTQTGGSSIGFIATNVAGFLVSPQRGLFLFLPLGVLLLFGSRTAWRCAEPWMRTLAAGGVAYTLVQLKINRFDGGDAFFGTRLSTELVVCLAPLAVIWLRTWVLGHNLRTRMTRALAALSVTIQAIGALAFSLPYGSASNPWHASPIWDAATARPLTTIALTWCGLVAAVWLFQREPVGFETISRHMRSQRPVPAASS
jgi:hypothetical protein